MPVPDYFQSTSNQPLSIGSRLHQIHYRHSLPETGQFLERRQGLVVGILAIRAVPEREGKTAVQTANHPAHQKFAVAGTEFNFAVGFRVEIGVDGGAGLGNIANRRQARFAI